MAHVDRTSIVIVGAGGFGREVLQYAVETYGAMAHVTIKGFLDDAITDLTLFGLDVPVLSTIDGYTPTADDRVLIAVGDPSTREGLASRLAARGAAFTSLVHPRAYLSGTASIGVGCIVAPFASVGAHATVGDHSVLTFYASVGHDATVGRWCALSPHSVANGASRLGDGVFLGSHAIVNPGQAVGERAKVAAGAVVYRAVPAHSLAVGNPARARPTW